ncbi:hypothetical protein GPECTOR_20g508 [Gonium pectorale]|uniref:ABC1 atypical kinase-like domain-containing protein n=1 Tax=Gonium pectorale TaxID=33097 RepID=A0A150GIM3_GONPE|nr:hypothetical protein GPECTOR_20g508 [Gonium pectorale]|eukprot:KXZ49651.1 hypothetical protein GPECTOR_20g508 [Gonium pectorale]
MQHALRKGFRAPGPARLGRQPGLPISCRASTTSAPGGPGASSRAGPSYSSGWSSSASDGSASASTSTSSSSLDDPGKRAAQLRELVQETIRITTSTGPRGFFRAVQAAQSVAQLAAEYLAQGSVDPPPVFLRKLFEKLGATYIKLGQFIASSPSLFPDEYVLEFQKCLDKTEPVPYSVIERIIEQELRQPWTNVFSSIDPTPLASASVAQVHAAVLRASGKQVVIKVLKPGVEDVLTADLSFVYLCSRFLEFVQPELGRLSLAGVLADMRTSMMAEVDFTQEAVHIAQFANFLDTRGFRSLATTPFVYKQFSSRRILVMERLVGAPLTDLDAVTAVTRGSVDPESVLIAALNTWFASVMSADTFHADVHAGNLLVLADGRVGFIDFGIVGRISPVTWKAVEALIASMATADYETMARALATIGACDVDVDFSAFARDLEAFFAELEQINSSLVVTRGPPPGRGPAADARNGGISASLEVDQAQLNRLFVQLVRIGETHGVKFPREFGLFLKQLLYFDRYTRILAPSLQVFNDDRINTRSIAVQYGGM